jgi:hypothetical protein
MVAGAIFRRVWGVVSDEDEAPKPTRASDPWPRMLLAAGLEGAVFATVKAAFDRGGAKAFRRLTGVWPGD